MFKFFRKYNRILLPVGVVVLMVLFLIQPTLSIFTPSPGEYVIGHVGDRKIRASDEHRAEFEMQIVMALAGPDPIIPQGADAKLRWVLMLEEARALGIHTSQVVVDAEIRQMNEQGQLTEFRQYFKELSLDNIAQAWAHYRTVQQLGDLMLGVSRDRSIGWPGRPILPQSTPALRHLAYDMMSQATVQVVKIPADLMLDQVGDPDESAVEALYEKHRADPAGMGVPYGFGYQRPPRVKLTYLTIPLDRVAESIEIDMVAAQRHYLENKELYAVIVPVEPEQEDDEDGADVDPDAETDAEAADVTTDDASSTDVAAADTDDAPAEEPATRIPTFSEVKELIIGEMRFEQARLKMDRMVNDAQLWLQAERRGTMTASAEADPQRDDDGYWELPADYEPPDYEELARYLQLNHGVLPDVVRLDQALISLTEVSDLPGLGEAYLQVGDNQHPTALYISSLRELDPPEQHPLLERRLQVGVSGGALTDASGNWTLFRAIDADPQRPPTSLDEVREEVVRDAKLAEAYRLLLGRSEEFVTTAREKGLEALAEQMGESVLEPPAFTRRQPVVDYRIDRERQQVIPIVLDMQIPDIEGIGQSEAFVTEVFALAARVHSAGGVDLASESTKISSAPVQSARSLSVMRLTEFLPVSIEQLNLMKGQLLVQLDSIDLYRSAMGSADPFTLDALIERVGYRWTNPIEPTETPEGEDAEAETDSDKEPA